MEIKNIGVKVEKPKGKLTEDKKSPFTGQVKVHGRQFTGTVISDSMAKTVTVEWDRKKYMKKYQRYEKRRSKVKAHNPDHIDAKKGDIVKIMETRPLSKTKNFVVIEVLGQEKGFASRMEAEEEAKQGKEKKPAKAEEKIEEKSESEEPKTEEENASS